MLDAYSTNKKEKTKQRMEVFIFLLHMDPPPVFGGLRVAHLFIIVRCVVCMCVGFFCPVFCLSNVIHSDKKMNSCFP